MASKRQYSTTLPASTCICTFAIFSTSVVTNRYRALRRSSGSKEISVGMPKRPNNESGVLMDNIDEDDLLAFLDENYYREQIWASKRRRLNSDCSDEDIVGTENDDKICDQVVFPLCPVRLHWNCNTSSGRQMKTSSDDNVDNDDTDLLTFLDVERKREHNRLYQRQFRVRRRLNPKPLTCAETNTTRIVAEVGIDSSEQCQSQSKGEGVRSESNDTDNVCHKPLRTRVRSQGRQKCATVVGDDVFDNELSSAERAECVKRLQKALGAEELDECVCAVCDRLVLRHKTCRKEDTDWRYMNNMKKSLTVVTRHKLCDELISQYVAPPHLAALEGVMVSPRGIHCYVDDTETPRAWFSVCNDCDKSIVRLELPKFAITNGFFVGRLEKNLRGLTLPERFMTQLVSIISLTRVMRGGRHRCIRSHCIAFDCTPGPPILLLPRSIEDVESFRVVMVGDFTPDQSKKARKMHRIRNRKIRDVFEFYKKHNHLYTAVVPNKAMLDLPFLDSVVEHHIVERVDDSDGGFDEEISKQQENIRGESDAWRVASNQEEATVIERRIGLSDASTPVMAREHNATAKHGDDDDREFEIRRSDKFSNDISGDLFARMFPHLFPFGRGHPGEDRPVHVSVLECVKYYTMLSGRQFAEDELFTLVAFDRISLQNMYIHNHYRCKRYPTMLERFESMTTEQLGRVLLENEQRRQGCLPWRPHDDDVARRFMKTVEIGTRSVWGSNSERSLCRHEAFAYQTRFGQPALFITLTPNTDNSLVLAHYAGISSMDTLFDLLESRLPDKAELREASLGNDCASTRLFMRQVDAFIRFALGMDPKSNRQLPFRGLLGNVKAYFGMVETQGRGTLHIHLLVWLSNCPQNSTAIERLLDGPRGENFRDRVASYAQSIVTNDLPIDMETGSCSECGASLSELIQLPILESARKDPVLAKRSKHKNIIVTEPALIQCKRCKSKFSSQHLLRSALLKLRPNAWPVFAKSLSAEEVKNQAVIESRCRNSMREAVNRIDNRELCLASLKDEDDHGRFVSEILRRQNVAQMPLCKSDDDPFRNDELTRLFEISPPSLYDERMPTTLRDYMVSALVIQFNQHLWNHTNSCFKQSRATVHETYCRYRFPRDRIEKTSFGASGVELRRRLGHEYINGFNYEIMATFRCNHDIQILLGGSDIADRIHYCCKYVTKQQNQIDSHAAIAVAALKRRQEREQIEMAVRGKQDRIVLARKRVAALMYNLTNRQEIAGPLATLYLYRGSCCYASHKTTALPLGSVIRQLSRTDDYSCALVNESDDPNFAMYQAVSFLDDYICRPTDLKKVNLYEFTMWYFRKKNDKGTTGRLRFLRDHPLYNTHSLGKRYEQIVPVIHGFRMPSNEFQADSQSESKRAVLSLVLFKPFRKLEDLIGTMDFEDGQAWLDTFDTWKTIRSKFVETIMDNMQDYYRGLHKAENQYKAASREKNDIGRGESGLEDGSSDSRDEFFCDDALEAKGNDIEERNTDESFSFLWDETIDNNIVLESSSIDPAVCPTTAVPEERVAHIIDIFRTNGLLRSPAEDSIACLSISHYTNELPSVDFMKKWVADVTSDNTVVSHVSSTLITHDTRVIELIRDALLDSNTTWTPSRRLIDSPQLTKRFVSITDISSAFSLNERQHYAVKAIAKALLSRWNQVESLSLIGSQYEEVLRDGQLLLFLGGEGGTGKSRVIDAVQHFCESWGRPDCVIKAALTGKAATIIGGRTLASFLLQIRNRSAADLLINVELIIIDEVSMIRRYQLAQLDKRLRVAKRVPGVAFGGMHIVLVGDFLQLPPVGGASLYKDPAQCGKTANVSAYEIAGYQLWRSFKDVIILKECVRFHKDPEWGRGCQQARLGIWTSEFVDIVNSRVVAANGMMKDVLASKKIGTFVTADNLTRVSINRLFIATTAKLMPEGEHPVRVVANFKGSLKALNHSEVEMVMGLPDTKFGRMAPYLDLIVGMPIQVSQNVRAAKMVANGTLGRLEEIVYQPGTTFRLVHDTVADTTVKVPSVPPRVVLVRIERGDTAIMMQGCSDANIFPLFFDSEAYNPCKIPLPGFIDGKPRSLSLKIQQFPLVCAIASTAYKVQGETLDAMVVTEWISKCTVANRKEQPYLLVSRVTTRQAFTTLKPLTSEITEWAHPSQEALDEEARLMLLSCETIRKLAQ